MEGRPDNGKVPVPAQAIVIGAGIRGLSAAMQLRRLGLNVTVFEQREQLSELNTGLSLWAFAIRRLEELGLGEQLPEIGCPVGRVVHRSLDGLLLGDVAVTPLGVMTAPEENKALVRQLVEIVNGGDLEALEDVASGQVAEAARQWIGPFRDSFPDFRMEVRDLIAEGDKVVGHFKCSGTHQGEWHGVPASGRRFEDVDEIYIFRVADGKLAAATAVVEDNLTRMRQLGIQP